MEMQFIETGQIYVFCRGKERVRFGLKFELLVPAGAVQQTVGNTEAATYSYLGSKSG